MCARQPENGAPGCTAPGRPPGARWPGLISGRLPSPALSCGAVPQPSGVSGGRRGRQAAAKGGRAEAAGRGAAAEGGARGTAGGRRQAAGEGGRSPSLPCLLSVPCQHRAAPRTQPSPSIQPPHHPESLISDAATQDDAYEYDEPDIQQRRDKMAAAAEARQQPPQREQRQPHFVFKTLQVQRGAAWLAHDLSGSCCIHGRGKRKHSFTVAPLLLGAGGGGTERERWLRRRLAV